MMDDAAVPYWMEIQSKEGFFFLNQEETSMKQKLKGKKNANCSYRASGGGHQLQALK